MPPLSQLLILLILPFINSYTFLPHPSLHFHASSHTRTQTHLSQIHQTNPNSNSNSQHFTNTNPNENDEELDEIPKIDYQTLPHNQPINPNSYRLGSVLNTDDPLRTPWRVKTEEVIKSVVQRLTGGRGVCGSVTWSFMEVVVEVRKDGDCNAGFYLNDSESAVSSDDVRTGILDHFDKKVVKKNYPLTEAGNEELIDVFATHVLKVYNPDLGEIFPVMKGFGGEDRVVSSTPITVENNNNNNNNDAFDVDDLTIPLPITTPLKTSNDFSNHIGRRIMIQTHDPFGSNRLLTGYLIERDGLDLHFMMYDKVEGGWVYNVDGAVGEEGKRWVGGSRVKVPNEMVLGVWC